MAIPLLGADPKKLQRAVPTKMCLHVSTATLFITAKWWKQPKHPWMEGWINEMWSIHTVEYYSAMKRNKALIHTTTWRDSESITLSARHQSQKATYHLIPFIWDFQNKQIHRDGKQPGGRRGLGRRDRVTMATGCPLGVMRTFRNQTGVLAAQHCKHAQCHCALCFKMVKMVNFVLMSILPRENNFFKERKKKKGYGGSYQPPPRSALAFLFQNMVYLS